MRKIRFSIRVIASVLAVAFVASDLSYAAPALPFTPINIIQNPSLIQIPEGFARIKEIHDANRKGAINRAPTFVTSVGIEHALNLVGIRCLRQRQRK